MRLRIRYAVHAILVLAVVVGAALAVHYIPFDFASLAAWLGIVAAFAGLVTMIKPLQVLGLRTRRRAAILLLGGVVVTVAAVLWTAPVVRADGPRCRLDDFMPEYQFAEHHEGRVRAPAERVVEAVRDVSFADMPAAVVLMRLRAMADGHLRGSPPDSTPILDLMVKPGTGFLALDVDDSRELVYGMVGKPWANDAPPAISTPEEFLAFAGEPGQIRVAFDIRVVDEGDGVVRVSTETRTLGNDEEARKVFARYWRIIYPGSAIIRRAWLDAIIARAELRPVG